MSDPIKPSSYPEKAAFQLVVELIRAERLPMVSDNINGILKIYDQAVEHFKSSKVSDAND